MPSLEDIEFEYKTKIEAQQEPEKKAQLELEKERAVGAFLREELQRKDKDIWVTTALAEFPDATVSEINGDNAEAIKAAAKASHDRFQEKMSAREKEIRERVEKEYGKAAWGGNTGGNGSGTPTSGPSPQQEVETIYQALREGKLSPYQEKRLRELRLGPTFERMARNLVESA